MPHKLINGAHVPVEIQPPTSIFEKIKAEKAAKTPREELKAAKEKSHKKTGRR